MAIYFHDSEKLPVGVPVYGFAYKLDDDGLKVLTKCRPTLGTIEERAKYSYSGRFIPEDKSKKWCNHVVLIYADTYEEAIEAYNRMVDTHIRNLNFAIEAAQRAVAEAQLSYVQKEEDV